MDEFRNDLRRVLQVSVHLHHYCGVKSLQREPEPVQKSPTDPLFLWSCQEVDELMLTHRLLHRSTRPVGARIVDEEDLDIDLPLRTPHSRDAFDEWSYVFTLVVGRNHHDRPGQEFHSLPLGEARNLSRELLGHPF